MSEGKDPAIKLFGRTIIQSPEISASDADSRGVPPPPSVNDDDAIPFSQHLPSSTANHSLGKRQEPDKDALLTDSKEKDGAQPLKAEEITDQNTSSVINENPKTPSVDNEVEILKSTKTEEEQSETSNTEEKTLKKPDKILPCPRCNSMDTKFCYYNNYNVNQPRHFCKKCQRYWTAGGTMRNVPVGAGRRKNKNLASQYHHITVSEALQSAHVDLSSGPHHPTMNANGTVLTFGSDTPLCEPRSTVLKITEKTMMSGPQNGFHKAEELERSVPRGCGDNGDDHSSGSSVTAANSTDEIGRIGFQDPRLNSHSGFTPQVQCFPGAPWSYPWNPAQWNSAVPPGFPMPFYPVSPYWGCTMPGSWNVQWVPQPAASPPILGKHSRDEDSLKSSPSMENKQEKENNPEKCLWFPKTMRIDEPGEAERSSLWATLGFQNDKADCVRGGSLFKAFKSKGDEKNHSSEPSPVLQANPAALSRSLKFQESS
ncbi:hypothetical protein LguiB_019682 [Lonicera macranthoides]